MSYDQYDIFSYGMVLVTGYAIGYSTALGKGANNVDYDFIDVVLPYYSGMCVIVVIGMIANEYSSYSKRRIMKNSIIRAGKVKKVTYANGTNNPIPVKKSFNNKMNNGVKVEIDRIQNKQVNQANSGKTAATPKLQKHTSLSESSLSKSDNVKVEVAPAPVSSQQEILNKFTGTFKLKKFDNMDAFLSLMGAPWAARKIILSESPVHTYTITDNKFHIKIDGMQAMDVDYEVGASPKVVPARQGSFMDSLTVIEGGIVRLHRINETQKIKVQIDRSLSDDGKVLTLAVTGEKTDGSNKVVKAGMFLERR